MAAKRITMSSVDWIEFAKKIPETQRASFNAIKNAQDNLTRTIASLPENKKAIDWDVYKSKIAVAGMVDDFRKKYESLQIPYPKDPLTSSIDQQAAARKAAYEKLVQESKVRISGLNEEKAKWEAVMSPELMNREEFFEHFPDATGDVTGMANPNKPSMWPHNEDYDEWKKEFIKRRERGEFDSE